LKNVPEVEMSTPVAMLPGIGNDGSRSSPILSRRALIGQIIRFAIVGGANTVIDVLTLNLLLLCFPTRNTGLLVIFNSLAYTLGAFNSYVLNKYWTFRSAKTAKRREIIRFAIVNVFGIVCNNGLVWLAAATLHPFITNTLLWANSAKLVAVIGTSTLTYFGMRLWVFKHTVHDHETSGLR